MLKGRFFIAGAAAASLATASVASAQAVVRAPAPVTGESELGGGGALWFVALGILAAFITITVITNEEGDDEPTSP